MADLKIDLLNKLNNDKYYAEMEFVRLAQEPNMVYKDKIDKMSEYLKEISIINAQIGLAQQYLTPPAQQVQTAPVPGTSIHQGQTHGE